MSDADDKKTAAGGGKARLNNHRIYRPEAVQAYSMRSAGEPWEGRLRFEGWIILGLTLLAAAGAVSLALVGR